jgi:hypothetical protein
MNLNNDHQGIDGMKFALCVFMGALTYATTAFADVANDKLCILTALNLLPDIQGSPSLSVSALAPPPEYKAAAPVMSRLVEVIFKSVGGDAKLDYICTTEPSRQTVVTLIFTSPGAD